MEAVTLAIISVRVLSLYFLTLAINGAGVVAVSFPLSDSGVFDTNFYLGFAVSAVLAIALWIFAPNIAKKMIAFEATDEIAGNTFDQRGILSITLALVGIFTLVNAIPNLAHVTLLNSINIPSEMIQEVSATVTASYVSATLKVIIGLFLVLRSQKLAGWISRAW